MPRPGRLDGRTCLIVGGTSGIGLAAARRFLEEGARVVVAGRSPETGALGASTSSLRWARSGSSLLELEQGEPEVDAMFDFARGVLGGRLDILLHVAGISGRKFGDGPLARMLDRRLGPRHADQRHGRVPHQPRGRADHARQPLDGAGLRGTVVNVGSVLDRSPSPVHFGTLAYAASKGAVRALTLAAAARYAPDRIRFNLLVPGLIDTPMAARAVNDPRIRPTWRPSSRWPAVPDRPIDVAEAALYLCEPASRFVTGAELVVDGGWCVSEGVSGGRGSLDCRAGRPSRLDAHDVRSRRL